jgi:hypothetical protein
MGKIKIESDGTVQGTKVTDEESGKNIVGITSLKFDITPKNSLVNIEMKLMPNWINIATDTDDIMMHQVLDKKIITQITEYGKCGHCNRFKIPWEDRCVCDASDDQLIIPHYCSNCKKLTVHNLMICFCDDADEDSEQEG